MFLECAFNASAACIIFALSLMLPHKTFMVHFRTMCLRFRNKMISS
jgi:hypothetical protein